MTRNKNLDKTCEICGDNAVGRNFGAITCESCKAFFRRNSVRETVLKCSFDNNCIIEVKTRKLCKKCRLQKCMAAGMKKEFIQNKEQKELRKQTIEENKRKRNEKQRKRSDSKSSSATTDSTDSQSLSVDTVFNSNRNVQREVLTLNQCIRTHMTDQAMDVNQNFLLYLFTPLMRPINTYSDWNEIECKHLSDMCLASNVFRYPTTERHYEVYTIGDYYREWGNRLEVDAKNIVKYTKEMTKYCNVNQEDKLILIKYACMELIILRANYCWDSQAEKWTIFMDNDTSFIVPLDLLKSEKRNLFNTYKVYFNKILPEWNWDSVILDLLTAIVLFNPNRPNLSDRFTVKFQQQMYIHLLQRYLMLRFRWEWQWKAKMANLMNALIDLHLVSEIEIQNGVEEYIQYFGPIFREIIGN